ncbi:MAG: NAD(P)/FAD-dependent oxidoreductase, partial [Acidimicrobiia bacterium]
PGESEQRKRVVVLGGGFGGLFFCKALRDRSLDVTLVDRQNHQLFQPLLYQVATAGLESGDVCYSTRGIARSLDTTRSIQGEVVSIDRTNRFVLTRDGLQLPYDSLVIAVGGVTADFGVEGVATHAFGLKSAAEAEALRDHLLTEFEAEASRRIDGKGADPAATGIVIVGGGPTGVEMAGGYAELVARVLTSDYPEIPQTDTRVVLIEGQDRLLNGFADSLADNAQRTLEKMGVEVILGEQVAAVDAVSVTLGGGAAIPSKTVVWAAGIRAHPLAAALGCETTRGGRIVVDEHLRLPDDPQVHVIGDVAASPIGPDEAGLAPQVAPGAIQGGQPVARLIAATVAGDAGSMEAFRYRDKGSMATIGRHAAVVEMPNGWTIKGFPGWVAWLGLHLIMLVGFRNRASVLVNWAWNYLTYDRGSRSVIERDSRSELTPQQG